jgi:hypothetical protein
MIIRASCVNYQLSRNKSLEEAICYAKGLMVTLNDFDNLYLLNKSIQNAQSCSDLSPFVSTSPIRDVARQFSKNDGGSGYILTIKGPESAFYNFNKIRKDNNLPRSREFDWMNEMGIPFELRPPFKLVQVDQILNVSEEKICLYKI